MKGNIQRRTLRPCGVRLGRWALNVECWAVFLFLIPVVLLPAQSNTNVLPPLAPAYGEIKPTFWEQYGTFVLVAGFIFVAVSGAVCWLIFRPKPPVVVPPEVLARETLTKLAREPETGAVLSEISQTLQHYIITAFGLPPGEWTTAEFCAALANSEKIGAELAQAASCFLRECDQRKFAPANPNPPLNAANRALELVAKIELRTKPPNTGTTT